MFIRSFTLTRKKAVILVLLLGVVLSAAILFASYTARTDDYGEPFEPILMHTDSQRRSYLEDVGWSVSGNAVETLDLILPDPLSREYLQYNALQLQQGMDLRPYAGQQICRYTYCVDNYPGLESGVQANLYVCEGQLIAGDIFYAGADGFSAPLLRPQGENEISCR